MSEIPLVLVAGFLCVCIFAPFPAYAADAEPAAAGAPPAAATPAQTPEQQKAAMEAWAAAAKPSPEHEWIKQQFVGDWDADVNFMGAGGGGKSKGEMHCKMILNDRFLQLDY